MKNIPMIHDDDNMKSVWVAPIMEELCFGRTESGDINTTEINTSAGPS